MHNNSGLLGWFCSLPSHGDGNKRGQLEWKPNETTGPKICDRPEEPLPWCLQKNWFDSDGKNPRKTVFSFSYSCVVSEWHHSYTRESDAAYSALPQKGAAFFPPKMPVPPSGPSKHHNSVPRLRFIPVFSQLRSQPTGQSFPYIISILHSLCWNSVNSARLSTNEI